MTSEIPLPPEQFILDVGGGDFHRIGDHVVELFRRQTVLQAHSKVLEIGCGCGRIAAALTRFLSSQATYDGVDIVKPMVEWCAAEITSRFPNFHFHHADLANTRYPGGTASAASYRFPFDDGSFDFIFLASVFTHLNPGDTRNYLAEVSRLLSAEGQTFMTFFILTDDYRRNRKRGITRTTFDYGSYPYWMNDPTVPEAVSGYDEDYILPEIRAAGLAIDKVSYGRWSLNRGWTHQDAVVASKPQTTFVPP